MSSNSDLDLVFIYSDNVKAKESDSIPYTDLFHKLINILHRRGIVDGLETM